MAEVPGCFKSEEECRADYAGICEYVSKLRQYCRMAFVDAELADKVDDRNGTIAGLSVAFGLLAAAMIVVWALNCASAAARKAEKR